MTVQHNVERIVTSGEDDNFSVAEVEEFLERCREKGATSGHIVHVKRHQLSVILDVRERL